MNSRINQAAEVAVDYVLLSMCWLIASLPLVTAYPATAAMFGVIGGWRRGEGGILGPFVQQLREHLASSLLIGVPWTAIGGLLVANLLAAFQLPGALTLPFGAITSAVALAYALTSLYLFPAIVRFDAAPLGIVRNAALLALAQPVLSVLALFALFGVALATYVVPFTIVISGVIVALGLSALADRAIRKLAPGHGGPAVRGGR